MRVLSAGSALPKSAARPYQLAGDVQVAAETRSQSEKGSPKKTFLLSFLADLFQAQYTDRERLVRKLAKARA